MTPNCIMCVRLSLMHEAGDEPFEADCQGQFIFLTRKWGEMLVMLRDFIFRRVYRVDSII